MLRPNAGKPFLLPTLAIVIAGSAWFTYGAGFEHAFVGWGFLLASPFAQGALATGIGVLPFNALACLAAPALAAASPRF